MDVFSAEGSVAAARYVQADWAARPIKARLAFVRPLRNRLATQAIAMAQDVAECRSRPIEEALTSEVLPLIDACRFLERAAANLLAPRRLGAHRRPLWLTGTAAEIRREPLGVILILASSNYPLFLAAAQALQALSAGNAVLVKPAPGCETPLNRLASWFTAAGLPSGLLTVLDPLPETGMAAIEAGVDKVVLTGGAPAGMAVQQALAPHLTPAVMELSGSDPVFILPGADLNQAADAIVAGLTLNAGRSCIAPRRLFVPEPMAAQLERSIASRLAGMPAAPLAAPVLERVRQLIDDADRAGCRFLPSRPDLDEGRMAPLLLGDARAMLSQFDDDIFAPMLALIPVETMQEALDLAAVCPYALGASVFGPTGKAHDLALKVKAGAVTVNDLIVPTADPRLPFGGSGKSGFGVTRGGEGLLELTKIKTVSVSAPRSRPYHKPLKPGDAGLFAAYAELAHGHGLRKRCLALISLVRHIATRGRARTNGS